MSSRGPKLADPSEMQQNPCLELNNGDSSSNAATMGVPSCEETVDSKVYVAPMLQYRIAHNPSRNAAASLPSQSLYLHTCTSPPNSTFLMQYQSSTIKKAKNLHPCNNAV
ncbi:hypothetical protein V6N13_073251 [Hibiscus sabdariffa]